MIRLKRAIGACILASVLSSCQAIPAHTATYYVDTTGSNSNPGTEKKPWQTVARAVDTMNPGDTTYVKAGTYNEGYIRFKKSGTSTQPIKLLNYPGARPKIHFMNGILQGGFDRITIENGAGFNKAMGWITIEGFEIENGHECIKYYNANDLTIRKNWLHNCGHGILGIGGIRVTIDRNIINHNGQFWVCEGPDPKACNKDQGIYANGSLLTITNNLIYDNLAYGVQANGTASYDPTKYAGPEYAESHDWLIANNTFAYQAYRGGIVLWGFTLTNAQIANNIFYENGVNVPSSYANGIDFISMTSTGITIRNNLAYASGSGATGFLSSGANEWVHYTQSGNIVNTDDPRFVNAPATLPTSPNFALTERSPAIDKGLPLATIRIAFDGMTRPQGRAYDIGAYEYSADGDTQSPKAPADLQAH